MNTMEIMDPTGHVTLSWSPDDPAGVELARAEFERLKAAGFAFFATREEGADEVVRWPGARGRRPQWYGEGQLDVRTAEATREFRPRARRTVAVRPMAGG